MLCRRRLWRQPSIFYCNFCRIRFALKQTSGLKLDPPKSRRRRRPTTTVCSSSSSPSSEKRKIPKNTLRSTPCAISVVRQDSETLTTVATEESRDRREAQERRDRERALFESSACSLGPRCKDFVQSSSSSSSSEEEVLQP